MPHRTGLRRLGQGGSNLQACHHLTAERVAIIAAAVGASASGAMAGLPRRPWSPGLGRSFPLRATANSFWIETRPYRSRYPVYG